MTTEQTMTSGIASTRQGAPSGCLTMCGSHPSTASTLQYGSECWRMTECDLNKLSTFRITNLRRILRIFWPKTISNQHLLARYNQDSMGTIFMWRRWRWIGHVMRREEAKTRATQEHLASNGRRGARDLPSHLRYWSEAGPEQTGTGYLSCCPTCQPAQQAWASEWVSEWVITLSVVSIWPKHFSVPSK